jgi:hypothetical protein
MNVAELIEELKKMPQDIEVRVDAGEYTYHIDRLFMSYHQDDEVVIID